MDSITSAYTVRAHTAKCIDAFTNSGIDACVQTLEQQILNYKIKFPLLEKCAALLHECLPEETHIPLCTEIEKLKTIGGNVLIGIILQKRLDKHYKESIQQAAYYISLADAWYVCDIIGERVFGYALLHTPEKTLPYYKKLSQNESRWVVRSLGAGGHYAIKKGLDKEYVQQLFPILLTMANTKDKEIRQGVGWAAKTTAKFHPEIIKEYSQQVNDTENVANWFRKKIEVGLNRNSYAKGNTR